MFSKKMWGWTFRKNDRQPNAFVLRWIQIPPDGFRQYGYVDVTIVKLVDAIYGIRFGRVVDFIAPFFCDASFQSAEKNSVTVVSNHSNCYTGLHSAQVIALEKT